jgi:hypothetical protein
LIFELSLRIPGIILNEQKDNKNGFRFCLGYKLR